jgi:hypothetical protein
MGAGDDNKQWWEISHASRVQVKPRLYALRHARPPWWPWRSDHSPCLLIRQQRRSIRVCSGTNLLTKLLAKKQCQDSTRCSYVNKMNKHRVHIRNLMEQSPSEARSLSVSCNSSRFTFHCRFHKSPTLILTLSQLNPVHIHHISS